MPAPNAIALIGFDGVSGRPDIYSSSAGGSEGVPSGALRRVASGRLCITSVISRGGPSSRGISLPAIPIRGRRIYVPPWISHGGAMVGSITLADLGFVTDRCPSGVGRFIASAI